MIFNYNYNQIALFELAYIFPEILISLVTLYLLVLGLFFSKSIHEEKIIKVFSRMVLVFVLFASFLAYNLPFINVSLFDNMLVVDFFILTNKLFLNFLFIIGLFVAPSYLVFFKMNRYEFLIFILIIFIGSSVLMMSNDFLVFYLSLELQSLTFYLLATIKKNSPFSVEAGLKYFILGALASGFLLFGVSIIYGLTGTINFFNISLLLTGVDETSYFFSYPLIFGIFLILVFFFFKIAAAPFHVWSPDVYEGSPLASVVFMAVIPKFVFFIVLSRLIFFVFFDIFLVFDYLFTFIIFLSFIFSTFNALQQKNFKRFFAYSSIGHVGFMLLALNSLTVFGYISFLFYLYAYTLMNLLVWCLLIALKNPLKGNIYASISNLANLSKINMPLAICFSILLMSMAGIPPFIGFFSKFWVFLSAFQSKQYFCLLIAVLSSVFSAYYYLRIIKVIFFEDSKTIPVIAEMDKGTSYAISFLTILLIIFFVFSDYIFSFMYYQYLNSFSCFLN